MYILVQNSIDFVWIPVVGAAAKSALKVIIVLGHLTILYTPEWLTTGLQLMNSVNVHELSQKGHELHLRS